MKLYDFLFEKGVLRKFKRNWIIYNYHSRESVSAQDKMFNDWLNAWGEHPDAIRMAFTWSKAKHGKYEYWSRIDSEWRMYLTNKTKRDE